MCKKKGKELNHSNQLLIGLFVLFVLLVVSHDYRGIMANKKQEPFTNTCVHLEVLDGAVLCTEEEIQMKLILQGIIGLGILFTKNLYC
jgi:hypothetical protein